MKKSQIDTESDKKFKYFFFLEAFDAFFVKFFTNFVDWNVLSCQQGKVGCPVVVSKEFTAIF